MARASKPGTAARQAAARRAARPRSAERHARPAPAAAPEAAKAAQPATIEGPAPERLLAAPAVDAPILEAPGGEPSADALPPVESLPPEAAAPEPPSATAEPGTEAAEPAASVEPAMPADPAPSPREVRDLHGITLRFWQDQLERTMATGQAIMLCRSPQEAVRLQVAYVQASLASGLEHVGQAARLSQDIARDMLPLRPR